MPKMKSHKAHKRRIRITSTGKVMRTQCNVRHILADRSPKRMRNLHKTRSTSHAGTLRKARVALLMGQG